jgi:ABC-type nitrate/sulfonate/bicarbonate transport system substrate-binding protein
MRQLVRLVLLVAAAVLPAGPAGAQVKLKLGDLAQSLNGIAVQAMKDQKLDQKHGLSVEYVTYPTLDGLFTAIRGKDVDVGFGGWTAFAQFRGQGVPVTAIYSVGRGATLDVIVPQGSHVKSLADLKGKKIGSYAGAAGTATVLFRVLASKYFGFDPGKSGHLQFAAPGLLTSLIDKGELDAALLFDPLAAKAVASGKFRSVANLGDVYKQQVGEDFLWIVYGTNEDVMKRSPDALTSFNRAWIEAVRWVQANPQIFTAFGKTLGFDREEGVQLLRERVLRDYILRWDDPFIASLGTFARMANEVMGKGYLDTVPPEAFTTRFVPR